MKSTMSSTDAVGIRRLVASHAVAPLGATKWLVMLAMWKCLPLGRRPSQPMSHTYGMRSLSRRSFPAISPYLRHGCMAGYHRLMPTASMNQTAHAAPARRHLCHQDRTRNVQDTEAVIIMYNVECIMYNGQSFQRCRRHQTFSSQLCSRAVGTAKWLECEMAWEHACRR